MGLKDIILDPKKDPKEYTATERRASLLKDLIEAGHPRLLKQTEMAKKYGVGQPQICRDMRQLEDEVKEDLGTDAELITETFYKKGIGDLVKAKRYKEANELLKALNEWLFNKGIKSKAPEKNEITFKIGTRKVNDDNRKSIPTQSETGTIPRSTNND